jgi:class 3 adenylate cyclase
MFQIRIDRHRCIGAGNCVSLAPTAFDWLKGEFFKVDTVDVTSVDEELLRVAVLSCPTGAISIEDLEELLPSQVLGARTGASQRVVKTFMFTDIVKSTDLLEILGDEAWEPLLRWHDQTLRSLFVAHRGEEVVTTGDGFFVGFESPDAAVSCAIAIQRTLAEHRRAHGFAPQVRIGVHASGASQVGRNFIGKGVHEAARIAALGGAGQIFASKETVSEQFSVSDPTTVNLKGIATPMEIVTVDWR